MGFSLVASGAQSLSLTSTSRNRISNSGFTYGKAGNVKADGSCTHAWSAENRLSSLNSGSGSDAYDSPGQRVKKDSGKWVCEVRNTQQLEDEQSILPRSAIIDRRYRRRPIGGPPTGSTALPAAFQVPFSPAGKKRLAAPKTPTLLCSFAGNTGVFFAN